MRAQSIFFTVFGLLTACFSFLGLAGASLPYQDPTPAVLEEQSMSVYFWWIALFISAVIFIIGVRGLWKSRR